MSQLSLEPLYLIDHNLSYKFADVLVAVGFNVTSVTKAFPGRERVLDDEIIDWLAQRGRQNAVWITADEEAQKVHAKLIVAKYISVLWIWRPKGGLTGLQELQLLSLVIEHVTVLVVAAQNPIYLRASLHGRRSKLERIVSPLTSKKLDYRPVLLPR